MAVSHRLITLVHQDGSTPAAAPIPPEPLELAQWEDGEVHFNYYRANGLPKPIASGDTLVLTVRRNYYDPDPPPISVEATVTNMNGGLDCGYFEVPDSLTGAMEVAGPGTPGYLYDVDHLSTVGPDTLRAQVKEPTAWTCGKAIGIPGTLVTPGVRQPALGLGNSGVIDVVERTINQAGGTPDGRDFRVVLSQPASVVYEVVPIQISPDYTGFSIPNGNGDRTTTSFRVKTAGLLPTGAVVRFLVFRTGALP